MSIELKANEARRRQQNRRKDIEKKLFVRSFHLFSSRDVSPFRYTNVLAGRNTPWDVSLGLLPLSVFTLLLGNLNFF